MAVASKKQSRTAGKGVKSKPKRKTAKKSRTKTKMRLVKKSGRKKSRRSKKFKGSKEISIKRVLGRANNGALVLACEGWTAENRRGDEFIGRRPSWCLGIVIEDEWTNLNNIDESSVLIRSLSNGRDGLVDEMLEEFEEERQEFNGEYEADDDDEEDDEEDDDDYDEDDDYDD